MRPLPKSFAIYVGPWDIMSEQFIGSQEPPPAPSSFTRLQFGWIGPEQVLTVRPGETREVTLQPLAGGRGVLTARVPIDAHRYLLLENRQRVGGDAVLPSAGLLVLEVDTSRPEGAGIVRVADANLKIPGLEGAPFIPGAGEHRIYGNRAAGVAIAPRAVAPEGAMRLVVTTPERSKDFVPGDRR